MADAPGVVLRSRAIFPILDRCGFALVCRSARLQQMRPILAGGVNHKFAHSVSGHKYGHSPQCQRCENPADSPKPGLRGETPTRVLPMPRLAANLAYLFTERPLI